MMIDDDENYKSGLTLLHLAVTDHCCSDVVDVLLHSGIEINTKCKIGRTSLHYAIGENCKDIVEILIQYNADVNLRCEKGLTPLYYAVSEENLNIVKLLLKANCDVNAKSGQSLSNNESSYFETPLHLAVTKRLTAIIKILVEYSDCNALNGNGETPLYLAVKGKCKEIIEILLKSKTDVNIATDNNKTALHVVAKRGPADVGRLLIEYGANVNAIAWNGTPFHAAMRNGNADMVHVLLSNDADINIKDCRGDVSALNIEPWFYKCHLSAMQRIAELFIRHILKLESLNLFVDRDNLEVIEKLTDDVKYKNLKLLEYYRKCKGEIEKMKHMSIGNSTVKFHDVLTAKENVLSCYLKNEDIVHELTFFMKNSELFPMYWELLDDQFKKGKKRNKLLISAVECIMQISNCNDIALTHIAGQICYLFSNSDIQNLLEACNKSETI